MILTGAIQCLLAYMVFDISDKLFSSSRPCIGESAGIDGRCGARPSWGDFIQEVTPEDRFESYDNDNSVASGAYKLK